MEFGQSLFCAFRAEQVETLKGHDNIQQAFPCGRKWHEGAVFESAFKLIVGHARYRLPLMPNPPEFLLETREVRCAQLFPPVEGRPSGLRVFRWLG